MHAVSDSSMCTQKIQLLAFPPYCFQQQIPHRETVGVFLRIGAIWTTFFDFRKLMLVLMQQVFIEMRLLVSVDGPAAFSEEFDYFLPTSVACVRARAMKGLAKRVSPE
jgi:hypothetical protein